MSLYYQVPEERNAAEGEGEDASDSLSDLNDDDEDSVSALVPARPPLPAAPEYRTPGQELARYYI